MGGNGINISTTELRRLEFDLSRAPRRVRGTEGLRRAANAIEREMRVDATGHKGNYFGRPGTEYVIPTPTVSSELVSEHAADIGIEAKGVGNLFGILAYGSVKNAPAYDPGAGPRRAMNNVLNDMADHAEHSVFGDRA